MLHCFLHIGNCDYYFEKCYYQWRGVCNKIHIPRNLRYLCFLIFFLGYNLNITSYASRLDSTILYLVRPDGQSGLLKDKINHIVITVSTSFIGRTSFISADYSINGEHSGSVTGDGSTRGPQDSFIFFSFQYFSLIPLSLFLLIFIIFAPHILNISTSALFQHT